MIRLLSVAFAADVSAPVERAVDATVQLAQDSGINQVFFANRLSPDGIGGSAGIGESMVLGGDGRVYETTASVRYASSGWVGAAHVPWASYRTPSHRTTGLGNIRVEGYKRVQRERSLSLYGVRVHLPTGTAYTWTNDGISLWPSGGLSVIGQRRQLLTDSIHWLVRAELGVHGGPGVKPFPRVLFRGSLVTALDVQITKGLSATTEVALSGWDPSPLDVGGWVRYEPIHGLSLRAGGILPIGTWAGMSPSTAVSGVREATLQVALSISPSL